MQALSSAGHFGERDDDQRQRFLTSSPVCRVDGLEDNRQESSSAHKYCAKVAQELSIHLSLHRCQVLCFSACGGASAV